jgi:SAM-dependent methyltransferase
MNLIERSYSDLPVHKLVSNIIKKHSKNKVDIRDMAHGLVDWSAVRTILDIGCGYGWFEEGLKGPFDLITGIDCLEVNRDDFLATAGKIARETAFMKVHLPAPLDVPSDRFDFIAAAYSLYFFPGEAAEIARVLRPGGTFLAITHSEGMLEEGERFFSFNNLKQVIRGFSAENAEEILRPYFRNITRVDYVNSLVFDSDESEDLAMYIDFKGAFISKDVMPERAKEAMIGVLKKEGRLSFNKNDTIFVVKK